MELKHPTNLDELIEELKKVVGQNYSLYSYNLEVSSAWPSLRGNAKPDRVDLRISFIRT